VLPEPAAPRRLRNFLQRRRTLSYADIEAAAMQLTHGPQPVS
jgi:hypothetical protein